MNTSTIARYPQEIAKLSYEVLDITAKIRNIKMLIAEIESETDKAIAFSQELKNDSQRKAAKQQMLKEDENHSQLNKDLRSLEEVLGMTEISLTLTKNQFSIAKLEARERIAKLESLTA